MLTVVMDSPESCATSASVGRLLIPSSPHSVFRQSTRRLLQKRYSNTLHASVYGVTVSPLERFSNHRTIQGQRPWHRSNGGTVLKRTMKLLATALVAAALPLSLVACSKGGSTSSSEGSGGTSTLTMWTHNAGNKDELGAIQQVVDDYNASQTKYKVDLQAFPQDSYNQSVVAAASAKKLHRLLDIDQPNVADWAWAGYLGKIEGLDDILSKYLPSTVAKWNGATYAYGY